MTGLEFDLLGAGYAAGFAGALSAFAGHPVEVLISRHSGHLYSALATAAGHAPLPAPGMTEPGWADAVLPRLAEHVALFVELADEKTVPALTRARDLFAECTALHHAMLLPARQAIADLVAITAALDSDAEGRCGWMTALAAVTATGTPAFRAAERLAGDSLPGTLSDARAIRLVEDGASDGDGYGLAQPGWLDDASYAHRVRRLLRRFGVTSASLRSLHTAAASRQGEAAAELRRCCPATLRGELETLLAKARAGAALAEAHGPLMHVRYVCELRRLVLAHGRQLTDAGVLDDPHDIVHTRLSEIDQQTVTPRLIRARRSAYQRHLRESLPPSTLRTRSPAQHAIPPPIASRLGVLGSATGRPAGDHAWQGLGAAPGTGHGPVRMVRTQADFDTVAPGDVALVPDAGPAWGWLALAGVPLIIEHGSPLGHAPALAREFGTACVVVGSGVTGSVTEGEIVKVSGDSGEVTW
jgi:pyruvate,water dikinase